MPATAFNSLFEMPVGVAQVVYVHRTVAFNSLFEMQRETVPGRACAHPYFQFSI